MPSNPGGPGGRAPSREGPLAAPRLDVRDLARGVDRLDDRECSLLRKTIGLRCRRARLRLGLSQQALALAMERSSSWVREIERGDQFAPPYLLKALSTAIGVSAGWFYGEDGPDLRSLTERILEFVHRTRPDRNST